MTAERLFAALWVRDGQVLPLTGQNGCRPREFRSRASSVGNASTAVAKNIIRSDRKYPIAPMTAAASKLPVDLKR